MDAALLGVDIGTYSSKGVLALPDGTILATATRPHDLALPRPGWAEHDAETVWWADFVALCAELVPQAAGGIAAVCVSGIGPCLLAADANGDPLRPAILYGIDTRATREIAEQEARFGADATLARGGSLLTTQAIGPKLAWIRRNEPDVWAKIRMFLMAHSFIVHRLTGAYVLDHHAASQSDPLYDLAARDWTHDWAAEIAPGLPLPRLRWPAEIAGVVTPRSAALTGLPAGTPIATGTIDAWAEATSAGVSVPGDVMLMYGTTLFIVEVLRQPRIHPKLWGTVGVFPGTHNLAAGMATSGALTAWLRKIACDLPYETLVAEAAAVPPGSEGLVVLPYFAGERTPHFDPDARGVICGLTLSHGRGHVYRALLEATAYGVRQILALLAVAGGEEMRLVAVGGGTKGDLWTQIVSDVTGRPQEIPAETIGASYGDAFLAAVAVGLARPSDRWNRPVTIVVPNAANRMRYDALFRIYEDLYPATREHAHQLARMQRGEAV